ncbi:MAG: sulfatase-like hydrolase/transferase [Planctomycetota bacterium]|nr:sulfatase-like hydrolase/transferase [Planctomycetota bacterium]
MLMRETKPNLDRYETFVRLYTQHKADLRAFSRSLFANTHVSWIAPKKYFDLYDPEKLPLADNEFLPKGSPKFAATSGTDFYWYKDVPQAPGDKLPEAYKRQCLQGYLAAISYVDAQVGRLLKTLDETGLSKNTIVVFWSDHGYYRGEHTWWGAKHNNYEGATRNCLIIAVPSQATAGQVSKALAQSVDLAPTLTELCGLPPEPGFQGRSLKPIIDDPKATVNEAAFSWYPKSGYLGVSMRTDKWRYVEWTKPGEPTERELFNMVHDKQNNINVADKPELEKVIASLTAQMRSTFLVNEFKEPSVEPNAKQPAKKKRKSNE